MAEESRSVKKTKRHLRKALYELITASKEEKLFKKLNRVSVIDLCKESEISRPTFYQYYENLEDFYEKVLSDLIEIFVDQIFIWLKGGKEKLDETTKRKNLVIDENDRELLYILVSNNTNLEIAGIINHAVISAAQEKIKALPYKKIFKADPDKVAFLARGCFFVFVKLMHSYSSARAKEHISILFDVFDGFFKKDLAE